MKKKMVTGLIMAAMFTTGALAATGVQAIQAELRPDYTVIIDGETQSFQDAQGRTVYPVSYNHTTYLPIRAIGNIMGKDVGWDEATKTITLSNPNSTGESVVYEENGIKITYTGVKSDSFYSTVGLKIENTSDTNYTVQVRNVSVNGYMISPVMSCDVAAGKTANDGMQFFKSALEENSISSIENVEFTFHIFESDSWSNSFDSDVITINA